MTESGRLWKKLALAALLFTLLVRIVLIGAIDRRREIPIEDDDAYSYLMHASILAQDARFEKALLRSFADVEIRMPQTTWEDFYRNRLYHRIKNFYHSGHAVALDLLHRLGSSYDRAWWVLAYLFQITIVCVAGALAYAWCGPAVAAWTMATFGFSYVLVHHHLTAAPREWSDVGFLGLLAVVAFWNRGKSRILLAGTGFVFAYMCITSHSIGKALALQALALPVLAGIFHRDVRRVARETALVAGFLGGAAVLNWAILRGLGVPAFASTPVRVDWDRGWSVAFSAFTNRSVEGWTQLTPLRYLLGRIPGIVVPAMGIALMIVLVYFVRARRMLSAWAIPFLVTTLVARYSLEWVGQDFLPESRYYYFPEYYDTVLFFALALAGGSGLAALSTRLRPRPMAAAFLVFLALNVLEKKGYTRGLVNYFGARHDTSNPSALIERWGARFRESGTCVQTCEEAPLYMLMTHGRLDYPVAYRTSCGPSSVYTNGLDPSVCAYAFYRKGSPLAAAQDWQTVDEDRSFVIAKNPKF